MITIYLPKQVVKIYLDFMAEQVYSWLVKQKAPPQSRAESGAKSSKRGKPHAEPKSIFGSLRRKGKPK
jgi:hypothetical protein